MIRRSTPLLAALLLLAASGGAIAEERGFMLATVFPNGTADTPFTTVPADIQSISALGGTIVRFPIYLNHYDVAYWLRLAHLAEYHCWLHNLDLVLDLHSLNLDFNPFAEPARFAQLWATIAHDFSRSGVRVRYELLSEPSVKAGWPAWYALAEAAGAAIVAVDQNPDHKVVVGVLGIGFEECDLYRPLRTVPQSRQWVTAHCYVWNDAANSPTGVYPAPNRTYAHLRAQMVRIKAIEQRWPALRCFIGEIAWHRDAPGAPAFFRDALAICREFNIHATIHAFNEAAQWDYDERPRVWREITGWLHSP